MPLLCCSLGTGLQPLSVYFFVFAVALVLNLELTPRFYHHMSALFVRWRFYFLAYLSGSVSYPEIRCWLCIFIRTMIGILLSRRMFIFGCVYIVSSQFVCLTSASLPPLLKVGPDFASGRFLESHYHQQQEHKQQQQQHSLSCSSRATAFVSLNQKDALVGCSVCGCGE